MTLIDHAGAAVLGVALGVLAGAAFFASLGPAIGCYLEGQVLRAVALKLVRFGLLALALTLAARLDAGLLLGMAAGLPGGRALILCRLRRQEARP